MLHDSPRRGRPAGPHRQAAANWVTSCGAFTMGGMARSLGLNMRDANNTLARLRASGLVQVAGATRTPESKRPVALYQAVRTESPSERPGAFDLSKVWA